MPALLPSSFHGVLEFRGGCFLEVLTPVELVELFLGYRYYVQEATWCSVLH
jgi:hypothetical protein